jgi:putative inorganic carbon (hco3(-)) transporter
MALLRKLIYILIVLFPILEVGKISYSNGVSFTINDILVGTVACCYALFVLIRKRSISGKMLKTISVFFTVCILSIIFNLNNYSLTSIAVSSLYLLRWIAYSLIYFAIVEQPENVKIKLSKMLFLSGTIIIVLGFLQFIFYKNLGNLFYLGWDNHLYRLFSTFLDPNFAGIFFSVFTVYILGYLLNEKNKIRKIFYLILALFSVGSVILTYSRSALLSLIVSVFLFLILVKKIRNFLPFLILLAVIIFSSPKIFQTEGTNFFRSASTMERAKSINIAKEIFIKNPIIGVGFDTYRYAQFKYGFLKGDKWIVTHSGSGADNSYLLVLATTGIIGFVSYLILLRQMYLVGYDSKAKRFKIVFVSSLTGVLVSALFINSLFYPPIMLWLWVILGITENN